MIPRLSLTILDIVPRYLPYGRTQALLGQSTPSSHLSDVEPTGRPRLAFQPEAKAMEKLYHEICVRFPEVRARIFHGDEALPYLMMGHVADWLKNLPAAAFTPELLDRVRAFTDWCEDQPRGDTADDDLLTMLMVGFYEKLFEAEHLRALLPKLLSQETLTQNAEYFRTWLGEENYAIALKHFG